MGINSDTPLSIHAHRAATHLRVVPHGIVAEVGFACCIVDSNCSRLESIKANCSRLEVSRWTNFSTRWFSDNHLR